MESLKISEYLENSNDNLKFHTRCGSLVKFSNNFRCAERWRPFDEFNIGIVMTWPMSRYRYRVVQDQNRPIGRKMIGIDRSWCHCALSSSSSVSGYNLSIKNRTANQELSNSWWVFDNFMISYLNTVSFQLFSRFSPTPILGILSWSTSIFEVKAEEKVCYYFYFDVRCSTSDVWCRLSKSIFSYQST